MKKRVLLSFSLISVFLFLTGCSEIKKPITSESTGIWNEYIVYPLSLLIKEGAHLLVEAMDYPSLS